MLAYFSKACLHFSHKFLLLFSGGWHKLGLRRALPYRETKNILVELSLRMLTLRIHKYVTHDEVLATTIALHVFVLIFIIMI